MNKVINKVYEMLYVKNDRIPLYEKTYISVLTIFILIVSVSYFLLIEH